MPDSPSKSNPSNTHAKEYWTGDSRDGLLENGDGYHYYKLSEDKTILEAYEIYESESGDLRVCPMPDMININWFKDLGYADEELLEFVDEEEFDFVKEQL